jgi:heme A synthase
MKKSSFAVYSWMVLVYNVGVILWGAYVRATGSGAGCGSHWPLCNGEVMPRAPQIETVIEFAHRLSSGLAFFLVLIMLVWAFRSYPKGHIVRLGAAFSMLFIVTEALVGAGLVLFEWVASDASLGRMISISIHLVNTFLLLVALTLTAWWSSGGVRPNLQGHGLALWLFAAGFVLLMILGISGAVTALGDTLYPAQSLQAGIAQDFSPAAHFLVRLRIWHPVIAVLVGLYLSFLAGLVAMFRVTPRIRKAAAAVFGLFVIQLIFGLANLILLAPVWMQLVHLLLADLVWISFVLLAATNFAADEIYQAKPDQLAKATPRPAPGTSQV